MAWVLVALLFSLFWLAVGFFDKRSGNRIHPKIAELMSVWIVACKIYFDDKALSIPRVRLGFKLFIIGSVEYLCDCLQLSDIAFQKTAFTILREMDCSKDEALFLIDNYIYIMTTDFGHDAIFAGGRNIREWVAGENKRKVAGEQQSLIYNRKQVCSALLSLIAEWSKTPEIPEELFLIKNQYEGKKKRPRTFFSNSERTNLINQAEFALKAMGENTDSFVGDYLKDKIRLLKKGGTKEELAELEGLYNKADEFFKSKM